MNSDDKIASVFLSIRGGLARAVSWMMVGEPADWQVSGMIIELVVPAAMLLWQRYIIKG